MVVQVEEGSLKEKGKGAKNTIPPGITWTFYLERINLCVSQIFHYG
jgi:hypothetical protein